MIKLTNISGKELDISKTVSLLPGKHISGNIEITPRIHQMISMGLLKMDRLNDTKINSVASGVSTSGSARRKQVMNSIKAGYIKPSISLENIKTDNKKTKNKRNLKK